jgi:hypothetical protein
MIQIVGPRPTLIPLAVDEERGRAMHVAPGRAADILLDALTAPVLGEVLAKAVHVQTEPGGVVEELGVFERLLVFEEQVVHRPEQVLALQPGALGRLAGTLLFDGHGSTSSSRQKRSGPGQSGPLRPVVFGRLS